MRYYWCVNCGFAGDFKFERKRNVRCSCCNYDKLTALTKQEYDSEPKVRKIRNYKYMSHVVGKRQKPKGLENSDISFLKRN